MILVRSNQGAKTRSLTSTIYVKTGRKIIRRLIPMGAIAKAGGIQLMCGELVHANQKRLMGRMAAPIIIEGSRSSGMTLPCSL
jgi:hypothetical protein